ncbi:MAG: hypothetical protein JXR25_05830 [Pontiellaceae bacterium]|nr:hypothetical protein [Pontiellaceae bacterium]MBN2784327.1 hypothetical protein [Pontiellaceae bacterium]
MVAFSLLTILVLLGLFAILSIVLLIALAASRKPKTAPPIKMSAQSIPIEERNQRREAILEKLSAGDLSREEAEEQLLKLDKPIPEQMPVPPASNSGCGKGCLIAAISFVLVIGVVILLLLGLVFGVRTRVASEAKQMEFRMEQMHQQFQQENNQ